MDFEFSREMREWRAPHAPRTGFELRKPTGGCDPPRMARLFAACWSCNPFAGMPSSTSRLGVSHATFDFKYLKFLALMT